jgi:molybdopterin molybdotransferase
MISLAEAQVRLLASIEPLEGEKVPVRQALGRYAAADVVALRTQPVTDLSAMDGYALAGEGPWTVVGESAAGKAYRDPIQAGQAVRIFTGAAVPAGADRILIQEEAAWDGEELSLAGELPRPGQHIRHAGSDFLAEEVLIRKGEAFTAARIALAIMGGHAEVAVHRLPRIALLSTGDELVEAGAPTDLDQIPNSNGPMLAALLANEACVVTELPIVRDDMAAMRQAITDADCDILVTLGGASVGDHDLVRPALVACGATLDYWKVAMRPGKPVMAGRLGEKLVLGLPGNPVSAYATAFLFLIPALRAMAGAQACLPAKSIKRLAAPLGGNGPRVDHVRAIETEEGVMPVGLNDSAALVALAKATLLIIREPDAPPGQIGDDVAIYHLT